MGVKKKYLITILVVLISLIGYYVFTSLNIKMKDGNLLLYSSIKLSDENISKIGVRI